MNVTEETATVNIELTREAYAQLVKSALEDGKTIAEEAAFILTKGINTCTGVALIF